jgi:O-antigen/teichoic acid export membrane protein
MSQDKRMLFKRINKIAILFIIFGLPFAVISGYVILKMYGSAYPLDLPLVVLSATSGICISVDQLYGQLLNSVSVGGVKISSYAAIILAVVCVILSFLLIPVSGLAGAMVATIIAYAVSIVIMIVKWPALMNSY